MRRTYVRIASIAVAAVLASGVLPAAALEYVTPVLNECTVAGRPLKGLTPAEARALIVSSTPVPARTQRTFVAAGKTFVLDPAAAIKVDVDGMLAEAYAATGTAGFEIAPRYIVSASRIRVWVDTKVAKAVDRAPVSARYVLKGSRIAVSPYVIGRRLDRARAYAAVRSAVASSLAASTEATFAPVQLRVDAIRPSRTRANVGKAILVDESDRRLWLYDDGRVERTYRVAVGTSQYPTPKGTFKIIRKVMNPSWTNPAPSGWGAGMPAYIGPGPSNPLGTRALYLNISGIRIHGTSKRSSIGTAASHGCMRMLRENIEELYPLVPIGTPVFIVR